jgi:hypothetical protein
MEAYANRSGHSNVHAYELSDSGIVVQFKTGQKYLYTVASAGANAITTMHQLARSGIGLNSFINTHVRKKYARGPY